MNKESLSLLLRLTGIPLLVREVLQRRTVTILVYHRLDPVTADRHFQHLRRTYTPITLQSYLDARRRGAARLPPKSVIVTIDDGHESVYRLKPILLRHRMPVTVFLCSGLAGTARGFWFLLPGLDAAKRELLKSVPDEIRIAMLREMGFDETGERVARESLSESEISDLQALVDFQSHSASHPILTECSDEKATNEIVSSKVQLESRFGFKINAFAFPNGNYGPREVRVVKAAGYECALTLKLGFNRLATSAYELRRLVVRDDCGVNELIVRSCGLWEAMRALLRSRTAFDVRDGANRMQSREELV